MREVSAAMIQEPDLFEVGSAMMPVMRMQTKTYVIHHVQLGVVGRGSQEDDSWQPRMTK
jgi:hypothetical protein